MQLGTEAAGGSADAVAPAGAQRAEAMPPDISAHVVNQQVNPSTAGDFAHPLGNILLVVVDDVIRAQVTGLFDLLGCAGGGDDGCAHDVLEHLDRRCAHAGRR